MFATDHHHYKIFKQVCDYINQINLIYDNNVIWILFTIFIIQFIDFHDFINSQQSNKQQNIIYWQYFTYTTLNKQTNNTPHNYQKNFLYFVISKLTGSVAIHYFRFQKCSFNRVFVYYCLWYLDFWQLTRWYFIIKNDLLRANYRWYHRLYMKKSLIQVEQTIIRIQIYHVMISRYIPILLECFRYIRWIRLVFSWIAKSMAKSNISNWIMMLHHLSLTFVMPTKIQFLNLEKNNWVGKIAYFKA